MLQPTLNPDNNQLNRDLVLLNRLAALRHQYQRGDVVTLWSPTDPTRTIIKRIVAVEGDYVYPLKPHPKEIVRIPKGHCWIEGDENFHSKDSNIYGPVPLGLITAKVTHIVWPLSRLGRVPHRGRPERVKYGAGPSDEDEDDSYKPNFA
ncbi:3582_t:CDS:2 [Paraglomus brasilianum]|uniref:Mitochondrial inner membrane protease subunit 2 n=1 Tax=Paraglomus brasilianum TaxID=144538 RepID=A0A9N9A208_9GLOM|nr:3582_t:CDS:2 [Paraglomus brasilianum]